MPHGWFRPVAKTLSFGTTPLDVTGGAGVATFISKGAAGGAGAGGGGEGVGEGDGLGDGDGDGLGLGEGLGDGVDEATGAASSAPPHATKPVPAAAEIDSVKNSALRLMA